MRKLYPYKNHHLLKSGTLNYENNSYKHFKSRRRCSQSSTRIHKSLIANNCDLEIWVKNKNCDDSRVIGPVSKKIFYKLFRYYFSRLFVKFLKTENKILHSPQILGSGSLVKLINYSNSAQYISLVST